MRWWSALWHPESAKHEGELLAQGHPFKNPDAGLLLGLGCLASGAQLLLVREFLALFAGNELTLGGIFACWFLGIAIGAASGGRLARRPDRARLLLLFVGSLMALAPLGLISAARSWHLISLRATGVLPGLGDLLCAGLLFITPLAALVGMAFPLACRAMAPNGDGPHGDRVGVRVGVIGRVYVIESAGSIAGGLLIGVVLAGCLPPLPSLAILGLPLLGALAWSNWSISRARAYVSAALALGLVASWGLGGLQRLDEISAQLRFESLGTGGQFLAGVDSPSQRLDLANRAGQYNLFSDGKFIASFPDPYATRPRAHLVLSQHEAPRRVLYIGPTSAGFLSAALAHPLTRIDQVESDPAIRSLVEPYLPEEERRALDDPRLFTHQTDGRRFLRQHDDRWDLIFSDVPDPHSAASNRFFTREFLALAAGHLAERGVLVLRISSGVNVLADDELDLIAGLRATLNSALPHVLVIPGQETFLFGTSHAPNLLTDPQQVIDRHRASGTHDGRFDPLLFHQLVQSEAIVDLGAQLAERPNPTLNSDRLPVTYLQSVLAWSGMTSDAASRPLRLLSGLPPWAWFALITGPLFVWMLVVLGGRRRQATWHASLAAITATGAMGMTLELLLSFAYQAQAGSLYRELGLIVAAFMAGLVAGGAWIHHRLRHKSATPLLLAGLMFALAAFAAALPPLLAASWLDSGPLWLAQTWLILLVIAAGVGTGVVFPAAGQLAIAAGRPIGSTAGSLDAWDHLGAGFGALFSGLLLLPLLGMDRTCWLLSTLAAVAGLFNLLAHRGQGQKPSQG